jgi:hypothetical protein
MHNVTLWTHPSNYFGATWENWYSAGFGQSRDSDHLEASNFQYALERLLALSTVLELEDGPTVQIVRENHWAVGWIEWIAIHKSNTVALQMARQLCKRANDYPILDEEDFSRREDEECSYLWEHCYSPSERVRYFREHSYTCTAFTDLLQAIRAGSWYHAANMLHCPTDLLY